MSEPSTYSVERSVVVDAPAERVYEEVVDFHRWPSWSPWEDLDPAMQRTYSGAALGLGSVYEWTGNRRAGAGRMEIVEARPGSLVAVDLRFLKPFRSRTTTTFTLAPEGEQTRVTWTMTGTRTLGLKVMGIFTSMDKLVGGDFEKGLSRLRSVAEGRQD